MAEPSEKVSTQMSQLQEERARAEREASDPEIEVLFGGDPATNKTQQAG